MIPVQLADRITVVMTAATINALFGDLRHLLEEKHDPHKVSDWRRRFDDTIAGFDELRTREREKQGIDAVLHLRCRQAADDPHPVVGIIAHVLALQFHRRAQPAERQSRCYAWSWQARRPACPDIPFLRYGLAHDILNAPEFAGREGRDWGYFAWKQVAEILSQSGIEAEQDSPPPPGVAASDAPALLKLHKLYTERRLDPHDPVLDRNRDRWRREYALFPVLEVEWGAVPRRGSIWKKIWARVVEPIAALFLASAGWRYFWYVIWDTPWGYLTRTVVIALGLAIPVATYIFWGRINEQWIGAIKHLTW